MRRRTLAALVVLSLSLVAVAGVALTDGGPELREQWMSDTARDTLANHHAVGADGDVVVAPVSVPERDGVPLGECSLVRLDDNGETRWRYTVPEANCTPHALTEPVVADLTGDDSPEVAVVTTEEALVVFDADGAERYRVPMDTYGYGAPTVGDLTGDGDSELVASDIAGGAVVVDGETGDVLWRADLGASTFPTPVVADVDGDGANETLFGTSDGPVLLDADGNVEWRGGGEGGGVASMAVGEADGEANSDAVDIFVGTSGEVTALDGRNGSERWSVTFDGNPRVGAVGNGDDDSDAEVYATLTDGRVVAFDADSSDTEWEATVSTGEAAQHPAPKLGDLDGDGAPELVALTNEGSVSVLDPTSGETLATYERDVPAWVYPTLSDIDGDGDDEILVRYGDGRVAALEYATD
ncbi:PQQ-binding-like beta-propeller repeat protein [Haloprofundus salilacus]|uniref:outer membrane protein assembly factor BamB family protein n=1 Tax=Haloprofundus salilacus TaxID=2876190 RepID=UPI001CC96953|nr:PQQ-binding-like beta-propeller repeat protein [Haloprofundus salilacus]